MWYIAFTDLFPAAQQSAFWLTKRAILEHDWWWRISLQMCIRVHFESLGPCCRVAKNTRPSLHAKNCIVPVSNNVSDFRETLPKHFDAEKSMGLKSILWDKYFMKGYVQICGTHHVYSRFWLYLMIRSNWKIADHWRLSASLFLQLGCHKQVKKEVRMIQRDVKSVRRSNSIGCSDVS